MGQLFGLLGERLHYSLSPKIHSMIMGEIGVEGCYHLFEVEKEHLEDAVRGMGVLGVRGANVTIPYKVDVMKYLHQISPEALGIGAINTISFQEGMVKGYNTDYHGLKGMFQHYGIPIQGGRVVILGTGGGAKAVIQCLKDLQAKDITLVSRVQSMAQEAYQDLPVISYGEVHGMRDRDILINCTPLGMQPLDRESPVDKGVIAHYSWAIDLNYNPLENLFLEHAREAGVHGVNGLYMLVAQAVKSQEIWQQQKFPERVLSEIYGTLKNALTSKS